VTKILHVIDSGGLYGAENVLLTCVEEQIRLGCHPVICSIGDPEAGEKPLEAEARRRGFPIVTFRIRPGLNVAGALKIAAFARHQNFNVIHSHGYKGNVLFGLMPRFMRRLPIISTLHGWTGQKRLGRMALYQWLDRCALRFVDRVVVVSESMLLLKPVRRLKRVSVIRNGIDMSEHARWVPKAKRTADGIVIGAAGRLSPEKGFDLLVEALAVLRQGGFDARLIVIGEGPERQRLERLIQAKALTPFVQLPGYRADVERFFPDIDLFVVSSLTEGLPMSVLQAMRAGTPIVATAVGGIPEMLENGKAGMLVNPGDIKELARAIRSACSNQAETNDRIRRAHHRVKERYDQGVMAQSYCRLYATCLDSHTPTDNDVRGGRGASHEIS
jgi:glycosyltransferase involved in cell wall biosynthesis